MHILVLQVKKKCSWPVLFFKTKEKCNDETEYSWQIVKLIKSVNGGEQYTFKTPSVMETDCLM